LGIIFNAFYHVNCEGEVPSTANSSLSSPILFLMMVERTTETCRSEIVIKERIVSKSCVCVDWIATVMYEFDPTLNLLSNYNTVILGFVNP